MVDEPGGAEEPGLAEARLEIGPSAGLSAPTSLDGAGTGRSPGRRSASLARRAWPIVRVVVGFGIVGVAVWVLSSKGDELAGLSTIFKTFDWYLLAPAIVAEIGSYACFARMQYELLKAGHLRAPWRPLFMLTVASQALVNSLPAGNAVATVYGFRWFRRFGASNTLSAWAMAGTLIASMVSLSLVAVIGLALAINVGASFDLVPVLIGVFVLALAVGSLFVYERPLHAVVSFALRVSVAVVGRPRGDVHDEVARIMAWMTAVRLTWGQIGRIVWWGTANWLLDCACFALMFVAIDAPIPWKGLLLAYGAGQLAATLPLTPGGLGVVEGSITVALVAFGGAESSTVDAVLLYRLISFWFILVVGWLFIGQLALQVRRGHWSRSALASDVEAGPVVLAHPSQIGAMARAAAEAPASEAEAAVSETEAAAEPAGESSGEATPAAASEPAPTTREAPE